MSRPRSIPPVATPGARGWLLLSLLVRLREELRAATPAERNAYLERLARGERS